MTEIADPSTKTGLVGHFMRVTNNDPEILAGDLKRLSGNKLKAALAALGVELGSDKGETIGRLVKAVQAECKAESEEDRKEKSSLETKETKEPEFVQPSGKIVMPLINPDWRNLIPRPDAGDFARLEASLKQALKAVAEAREKGEPEPPVLSQRIKVTAAMHVIDGHTRIEILEKLGIKITEEMIEISEVPQDQVELEIFKCNVARRHLTDAVKIQLAQRFLPGLEAQKENKARAHKEARITKRQAKSADSVAKKKAEAASKLAGKEKAKAEKAAQKAAEKAKKAAEEAKKKAEAAKTSGGRTRDKVAKLAGVNPDQVKLYEWCKKYCPDYLNEQIAAGVEIGTIHGIAHDTWFRAVVKYAPELKEDLKNGKISLEDAYKIASERKPPEEEHAAGPLEKEASGIRDAYVKVLQKKYGEAFGKEEAPIDEYEASFMETLAARIEGHAVKGR